MSGLVHMRKGDRVTTTPALPSFKEALAQQHTSQPARICPICRTFAVVDLDPWNLAKQPDETTHICHPVLNGCNHGFSVEPFGLSLVDNG